MDPLSDVLRLVRVEGALSARLEATGGWALRFAGYRHLKLGLVRSGEAYVSVEGPGTSPRRVGPGDAYVLSGGVPYVLASGPAVAPQDGDALFRRSARDGLLRLGPSGAPAESDVVLEGATLVLDDRNADLLTGVLPPIVVASASDPAGAGIRATVELLSAEAGGNAAGADLIVERLTHVLFAQVLRAHVAEDGGASWLNALSDPQIRSALSLIHGDPERHWRVDDLATAVGLSRSAFAARFKSGVGLAPLEYALQWRMRCAALALAEPGVTVTAVAHRFGYASHSPFSTAFKRVTGRAPSQRG